MSAHGACSCIAVEEGAEWQEAPGMPTESLCAFRRIPGPFSDSRLTTVILAMRGEWVYWELISDSLLSELSGELYFTRQL